MRGDCPDYEVDLVGRCRTFAGNLVMRGVSLLAVKELLGHESIEMMLRYSHLSPATRQDAVKQLDTPWASGNGNRRYRALGREASVPVPLHEPS